jgi:hypothetical protein
VLGTVAVLPEHGVDVACVPICPMAGHIVPAVVGAEVAGELELLLVRQYRQQDSSRWCPLREVALHRRQRFPAPLYVFVDQWPLQHADVPAGEDIPAMRQVPRRRDKDLVVGEDLRLLIVEVRWPRIATAVVAAASLVIVHHQSWIVGAQWAMVMDRGERIRELVKGELGDGAAGGFVDRGLRIEAATRCGRHGVASWESAWPAGSTTPGERTWIHVDE